MAEAIAEPIIKAEWLEACIKKQAFFVLGAEGSGTNMLRDALVAAGCSWKQGHESYQDDYHFEEMESPFVFRRSLPHAGEWPDLEKNIDSLIKADFYVHVLFIIRDFFATASSVVRRDYQRDLDTCYSNQQKMLTFIGEVAYFDRSIITYITYEAFCLNEGFRKWLFEERLGLPYPADFQIWYANDQYYKE